MQWYEILFEIAGFFQIFVHVDIQGSPTPPPRWTLHINLAEDFVKLYVHNVVFLGFFFQFLMWDLSTV